MRYLISITMLAILGSCGSPSPEEQAWQRLAPAARQQIEQLYTDRCATCHGKEGRGDGPSAGGLKVGDFTLPAWPGERSDTAIKTLIRQGTETGMPSHPGIDDKLDELLVYLKRF